MKVKLSDAFDLQMGKTPPRNDRECWGDGHKWISISDIGNVGKYIDITKEEITDIGVSKSGIKVVPKGTVIMSFKLSIGKTAITAEDMYTNEAIMAFINKGKYEIDTDYLYHMCKGIDWFEGTNKAVLGLTLNKATMSEKEIEIPSMEVQSHVVLVLDKMDELIALRKEQLAKLDHLVKSRFIELFGDEQEYFAKAHNHVSDVCESKVGIVIQPTQYYTEDSNNSVKAFRSLNVKPFRVNDTDWVYFTVESNNLMQRTQVHTNDVAVVRSGVNLGDSCVVTEEFDGCNAIDILILTPKSCLLPIYLSAFINYPCGKNQIINAQRGGALKHLNNKQLQDAQIYLPPIEIQKQFATFVEQTDKSKLAIQQSLDKLETLKKSLMQEYFG